MEHGRGGKTAAPSPASVQRWRLPAALLGLLRRHPGLTRAEASRLLRVSSGSATEVVTRLRDVRLLAETPVLLKGRGRPTTRLLAHPEGPVVLALDLRTDGWRAAVAGIDGRPEVVGEGYHARREPDAVLDVLRGQVTAARARFGSRLRIVSLAVCGTIRDGILVQASTMGWGSVDVAVVTAGLDVPLLVGNDATLAAVAEARTGAARSAQLALHIMVEVGVGGALVDRGNPLTGATGSGGEFGHLPFGDPRLPCPCGAHGCWDLEVDGRALARHLGEAQPADPRAYALAVLDDREPDQARATARRAIAQALGRGVAGLVNAADPDVVTLGGLAVTIRATAAAAFDDAYAAGLMSFRRSAPPPVLDGQHLDDGALVGAVDVGLDPLVDAEGLRAWAEAPAGGRRPPVSDQHADRLAEPLRGPDHGSLPAVPVRTSPDD